MAKIQDPAKACLTATIDCNTGEFDSDFGGSASSLTVLVGACIAHISRQLGEGDPAQSRLMLVKMSREAVSFALNALDDFENEEQEGGESND